MSDAIGKYEGLEVIGHGTFATVYKAFDSGLQQTVAVKVLKPVLSANTEFIQGFINEARLTAKLRAKHLPHIAHVYDTGEANGYVFIAMDYIKGETLAEMLKRKEIPSFEQAVEIIMQIAQALDAAHSEGILHLDVKPSNILLDENGNAYLSDFGLARAVSDGTAKSSFKGMTGTAAYLSPEAAKGILPNKSTDIYSLAVVAYELFTGRTPFLSNNLYGYIHQHADEPPPPPRQFNSNISPTMQDVLLNALAKEPGKRPSTAKAFAAQLKRAVSPPPSFVSANNTKTILVKASATQFRLAMALIAIVVMIMSLGAGLWAGLKAFQSLGTPTLLKTQISNLANTPEIKSTHAPVEFALTVTPTKISVSSPKWTLIGLSGESISSLVPMTNGLVYASTNLNTHGIFKSNDSGETWVAINNGLGILDIENMAVAPDNQQLLYAIGYDQLWGSKDGGAIWQLITNPGLGSIRGITLLTRDGLSALAYRPRYPYTAITYDGGGSWSQLQVDCDLVFLPIAFYNRYIIYSAGCKSIDGGKSWLPMASVGAQYPIQCLGVDPTNENTIYAGTLQNGLYKSIDGGGSWVPINTTLPNQGAKIACKAIEIDPLNPLRIWASLGEYGIWQSDNGGADWFPLNDGFEQTITSNITTLSVSSYSSKPRYLFAGASSVNTQNLVGGVWRYTLP